MDILGQQNFIQYWKKGTPNKKKYKRESQNQYVIIIYLFCNTGS